MHNRFYNLLIYPLLDVFPYCTLLIIFLIDVVGCSGFCILPVEAGPRLLYIYLQRHSTYFTKDIRLYKYQVIVRLYTILGVEYFEDKKKK
jgi:hypothetical protein